MRNHKMRVPFSATEIWVARYAARDARPMHLSVQGFAQRGPEGASPTLTALSSREGARRNRRGRSCICRVAAGKVWGPRGGLLELL